MLKQALDSSRLKIQLLDENQASNQGLSERVDTLEKKLDLILQKLNTVEKGTDKMASHIDFINNVYSRVQTPLFWICDRINNMRGYKVSHAEKQLVTNKVSDITEQD
jgi:predicted nuclease with TOPRIM domain